VSHLVLAGTLLLFSASARATDFYVATNGTTSTAPYTAVTVTAMA
jgi:hypothetical protein